MYIDWQCFWRILLFFILRFLCQPKIQIKVIDESDKEVLAGAHAQNHRTGRYGMADEQGLIHIHALSGDSVQVHCLGYNDTMIMIRKDVSDYRVKLNPFLLTPVVIIGSESFHRKAAQGLQNTPMKFLTSVPGLTGESVYGCEEKANLSSHFDGPRV